MCGIVGIFSREGAACEKATLGLFALQHRGQESCGLAWVDNDRLRLKRGMGLVKEVFPQKILADMKSQRAIGHVRYPTQGGSFLENAQPHLIETLSGPHYCLASNGDLINYPRLRQGLTSKGIYLNSTNDGEAIARYLVFKMERENKNIINAIRELFTELQGAYSTVFLTPDQMVAFRDPYGFRPMLFGQTNDGWAVTSESCALDLLRATDIKEIQPGQIFIFKDDSKPQVFDSNTAFFRSKHHPETAHCVFEFIYFARPDSFQYGRRVHEVRRELGRALASYDSFRPDCVVPVPDSSNFIAQGYAQASGVPMEFGLIRNHYVGRTFIQPQQTYRDESVNQKFNPLAKFFDDKKVVLVDDSIVRGTTLRKIVRMIKGAGASEVHVRIGSPPVKYPCFYGIDTPTYEELIANQMDTEQIRQHLDADSLKYLNIEDLDRIVGGRNKFCFCCFDGHYPVGTPYKGKKLSD